MKIRDIMTTHGVISERHLDKTTIFTEHDDDFVINVEYRLVDHREPCPICDAPGLPAIQQRVDGVALVRRDAHAILKDPAVVGSGVAASM